MSLRTRPAARSLGAHGWSIARNSTKPRFCKTLLATTCLAGLWFLTSVSSLGSCTTRSATPSRSITNTKRVRLSGRKHGANLRLDMKVAGHVALSRVRDSLQRLRSSTSRATVVHENSVNYLQPLRYRLGRCRPRFSS